MFQCNHSLKDGGEAYVHNGIIVIPVNWKNSTILFYSHTFLELTNLTHVPPKVNGIVAVILAKFNIG